MNMLTYQGASNFFAVSQMLSDVKTLHTEVCECVCEWGDDWMCKAHPVIPFTKGHLPFFGTRSYNMMLHLPIDLFLLKVKCNC